MIYVTERGKFNTIASAINSFRVYDLDGKLLRDAQVEPVRTWALGVVRQQARERAADIDQLISDYPTLATEITLYFQAGRPADPNANLYRIAAALANRQGVALRAMLEGLLSRWQNKQAAVAALIDELVRVEGEIQNASDIAGVEAALAALAW